MRVLVCGGRDYNDPLMVRRVLMRYEPRESVLICGDARGADRLARKLAAELGWLGIMAFAAEWGLHGKAAGPIRNQRMLDEGDPDICVAFPGGRGTADMVRRAEKVGIKVRLIPAKLPK